MLINNSFLALAATVPASTAATKTANALALAAGVDGDGAGPPAMTVVAGWRGRPAPYAAHGLAPSPHKKADLGALEAVQRQLQSDPPCPTLCPPSQVGYCAGSPISAINDGLVCEGKCCTGEAACQHFTGCVKKDGSCDGYHACLKAFAPSGIEDSCKGYGACKIMGGYGGSVGALKGSCIGDGACEQVGAGSEVGAIYESCNGYNACHRMGVVSKAPVGALKGSCTGDEACKYLASGGEMGAVIKSCNGDMSCFRAGENSGKVEALDKSCNGLYACYELGRVGAVGPTTKSCNRDDACRRLGWGVDSIESITKTCNNDKHKPCRVLERRNGYYFNVGHLTKFTHAEVGKKYTKEEIGDIGKCNNQCVNDSECKGIKWKDHSGMPCRFFGGEISENPCNGRNVCITM